MGKYPLKMSNSNTWLLNIAMSDSMMHATKNGRQAVVRSLDRSVDIEARQIHALYLHRKTNKVTMDQKDFQWNP